MVAGILIFQGGASQVFHNVSAAGFQKHIFYGSQAVLALQRNMMERQLEEDAARLSCTAKHATTIEYNAFYRTASCSIDTQVSDYMVIVGFYGPQQTGLASTMAMHAQLWLYVVGNPGQMRNLNETSQIGYQSIKL